RKKNLTNYTCIYTFFFFSSRRRHTSFSRDWSSDVCSSDLTIYRKQHRHDRPYIHDFLAAQNQHREPQHIAVGSRRHPSVYPCHQRNRRRGTKTLPADRKTG